MVMVVVVVVVMAVVVTSKINNNNDGDSNYVYARSSLGLAKVCKVRPAYFEGFGRRA